MSRLALLFVLAPLGCAPSGGDSERSLPLGRYEVSRPMCASTGELPAYPDPRFPAALYDLEGLTERLIVMRERDAEQIFATADCRLTITRELGEHHDGHFAFTVGRRLVWEPEGCSLTVFAAGREAVVGPDYSPLYRDAAGSEMDLLFEVERNGQKFTLTSIDLPSVNDAWAAYGCAKPDRLRYSLVRIKGVP